MNTMINTTVCDFMLSLASKNPVPGGGGASALVGSLSAALCSMVANLTSGKKKYVQYQIDIERIIADTDMLMKHLLSLIEKDAEVFAPLAAAYGISKDAPERDVTLESALKNACTVPFNILTETSKLPNILDELIVKGSRLALSDVGVSASLCRSAAESAALNVYINTKLIHDRNYADDINAKTTTLLTETIERCSAVYDKVQSELMR